MKKIILILFLSLAMTSVLFAVEKPTEESLIKAWEALQKGDPHTTTFEKIADHCYKFKTNLFPFDGELRINDATIDNMEIGLYDDGFIMGFLDIELVGLPKDVTHKYSRKYYIWDRNNTLYCDKKAGAWLSPQEYQGVIERMTREMNKSSSFLSGFVSIAALIFVLAIIILFIYKSRKDVKTSLQRQAEALIDVKKSIKLGEKATKLSEETNRILKEILEVLKRKG